MAGGMPSRPRTHGDGDGEPAQLSVNGTDRTYRARTAGSIRRPARVFATLPNRHCDRTFTPWEFCASNMNSKPRRAAALGAAAICFVCRRHRATLERSDRHRCIAAVFATGTRVTRGSGCPLHMRVSASLARSAVVGANWRRGVRKRRPPWFPTSVWGAILGERAGCPNATQPEPVTVSASFIRPRRGNWQAVCGAWRIWR